MFVHGGMCGGTFTVLVPLQLAGSEVQFLVKHCHCGYLMLSFKFKFLDNLVLMYLIIPPFSINRNEHEGFSLSVKAADTYG
jgi:hypothetical protein